MPLNLDYDLVFNHDLVLDFVFAFDLAFDLDLLFVCYLVHVLALDGRGLAINRFARRIIRHGCFGKGTERTHGGMAMGKRTQWSR